LRYPWEIMLSVGIIGLPNVGKSTLWNALVAGHGVANVSNYPFTTIEPNVGMVPVPDNRLERLAAILDPEEVTPCSIRFIDIAGLVEGASRGEGLGNQFLGEIRQVDAVVHVVRAFDDPDVAHVAGSVDPVRDLGVIETELLLADLEVLQRAIEKRRRDWQTKPRDFTQERERWERYHEKLEAGEPLSTLTLDAQDQRELKALGLLTGKPILYAANVSEEGYGDGTPSPEAERLRKERSSAGVEAEVVEVSAKLEMELASLEPDERAEFMAELGLERTGLERVIEASFHLLGLIRFYTIVSGKLRAWEIPAGTPAPEAAGKIHTDMEHGFIRAQVTTFEDLVEHETFQELHRLGKLRTEGKSYEIEDGDVVEFLFSP